MENNVLVYMSYIHFVYMWYRQIFYVFIRYRQIVYIMYRHTVYIIYRKKITYDVEKTTISTPQSNFIKLLKNFNAVVHNNN